MSKKIIIVLFLLIICIAVFLRTIYLDRIPVSISGDELDYIVTAKSIYLTGQGLSDKWNPFSLTTPPYEVPKAELPYILLAPMIGPLDFSLFAARIPFVMINISLIFVVIVLTVRLFDWKTGIIAGLLAAINPWFIYFSRTSFDTPIATLFMYIGLLLLFTQKSWKILWSFPFFFIGFYSYIGMKVVFLPFVFVAVFGSYYVLNKKNFKKQHIVLAMLFLTLVVFFAISFLNHSTLNRAKDISSPFDSKTAIIVDNKRRMAVLNPITPIFVNKFSEYAKDRFEVYTGFFSINYLFLHGDTRAPFTVWEYGTMHVIDLLFITIGIIQLIKRKRSLGILLLSLLLIAPIPSIASNEGITYSVRSNLAFPLLIIISAYGIRTFISKFQKYRLFTIIMFISIYGISTVYFMYLYLFRNPVYNSEGLKFSSRIAASYIHHAIEKDKSIILLLDGDNYLLRDYFFYYNIVNRDTIKSIKPILTKDSHIYNGITFGTCDDKIPVDENTIVITKTGGYCDDSLNNYLSISQLSDGGEVYKIYSDSVCSEFNLNQYPNKLTMNQLSVEKLSDKEFCETFIYRNPEI